MGDYTVRKAPDGYVIHNEKRGGALANSKNALTLQMIVDDLDEREVFKALAEKLLRGLDFMVSNTRTHSNFTEYQDWLKDTMNNIKTLIAHAETILKE